MATSNSADLFESTQVSLLISVDETLQFLEDHGFFYQGDREIGKLVDEVYSKDRARSDDAKLEHFKPTIQKDSRLSRILNHYPTELPRFRFPWGTTPSGYYNWVPTSDRTADSGLVAYMLGSESQWACRDGSHRLDSNGELLADGTLRVPDALLQPYPKKEIKMEEGGVLLVNLRLAHQAITGRSIMLGLWAGFPPKES